MIDLVAVTLMLSRAALEGPTSALRALEQASREALEVEVQTEPEPVEAPEEAPEPIREALPSGGPTALRITGGRAAVPVRQGAASLQGAATASQPSASAGGSPAAGSGGQIGAGLPPYSISSGSTAGGSMSQPPNSGGPPASGGGISPELLKTYLVKFFPGKTGTGYSEEAMVYVPAQSQPRPLLVVFHKWGVGHLDTWVNTSFFQEAKQRGWHVLAPLSASGVHVNSLEGQENTAFGIRWMQKNFNVDPTRIYGVGFSMGGASVANFAARYLDPSDFMFAAIVDHTGGVSHIDTYNNSSANAQYVFDFWFGDVGATPVVPADPWEMKRSSVIDFDPQTLVVDTTSDLARNLTHVQVKVSWITNEPQPTAYLTTQSDVFFDHLEARGGSPIKEIVPFAEHSWDGLDEKTTMHFLDKWTLRVPTNADTLADRPGKYFYFTIQQDAPDAFTPFSWSINDTQNKVLIWKTENLAQVDVDLLSTGLSSSIPFRVVLETNDGLADDVVIQGWPSDPTDVVRDGLSQVGLGTYSYDAQKQELLIDEWEGDLHVWDITP